MVRSNISGLVEGRMVQRLTSPLQYRPACLVGRERLREESIACVGDLDLHSKANFARVLRSDTPRGVPSTIRIRVPIVDSDVGCLAIWAVGSGHLSMMWTILFITSQAHHSLLLRQNATGQTASPVKSFLLLTLPSRSASASEADARYDLAGGVRR